MSKNILILTDFSKSSWDALLYALELYKDEECNYYILNTYDKEAYGLKSLAVLDPEESFNNLSKMRSEEGLGDIMTRLMGVADHNRNNFYTLSRPYGLLDATDQVMKELPIDLIFMGAKGFSDENAGFYGSSTLDIIKNIRNCPVIVVPKNAKYQNPKEIVLATDFKSRPNEADFNNLTEISKRTGAEICVLSLSGTDDLTPQQKENRTVIRNLLSEIRHSFHILHNVDLPTAISCFVESRDSHMVSIVQTRPGFWQRMGLGKSLLDQLLDHSDVPLMAMHGSS